MYWGLSEPLLHYNLNKGSTIGRFYPHVFQYKIQWDAFVWDFLKVLYTWRVKYHISWSEITINSEIFLRTIRNNIHCLLYMVNNNFTLKIINMYSKEKFLMNEALYCVLHFFFDLSLNLFKFYLYFLKTEKQNYLKEAVL